MLLNIGRAQHELADRPTLYFLLLSLEHRCTGASNFLQFQMELIFAKSNYRDPFGASILFQVAAL